MLYAILCYSSEGQVCAMSKEQDDELMKQLAITKHQLNAKVKFGPTARLMPTTAATTLRHGKENMVLDGPFAETKEQLLGFYLVECDSLEQAIETAKGLAVPRREAGLSGALEIRPVGFFDPSSDQ